MTHGAVGLLLPSDMTRMFIISPNTTRVVVVFVCCCRHTDVAAVAVILKSHDFQTSLTLIISIALVFNYPSPSTSRIFVGVFFQRFLQIVFCVNQKSAHKNRYRQ